MEAKTGWVPWERVSGVVKPIYLAETLAYQMFSDTDKAKMRNQRNRFNLELFHFESYLN